jgi:hypothetical protein
MRKAFTKGYSNISPFLKGDSMQTTTDLYEIVGSELSSLILLWLLHDDDDDDDDRDDFQKEFPTDAFCKRFFESGRFNFF